MINRKVLNVSIERTNEELEGTRKKFTNYLDAQGIDIETALQIDLAVYELAANIIEHGGTSFRKDPIAIICSLTKRTVTISITYRGIEFDLTRADLPDIKNHFESGKDGGLGIYIILTLMDSVTCSFNEGVNTVIMKKKVGSGIMKSSRRSS